MKLRAVELPAEGLAQASRTLVLLHGFGADEHDLLPIARELDPSLHAISLQAPIALEYGGRAWYRLEQTPQGIAFDAAEVACGEDAALEAIEEIAAAHPRPILCGFSQGAGMALGVALRKPQLAAGVMALSAVPPRLLPQGGQKVALRVFLAHGTLDPLLPIEVGRATRDLLVRLGADVTFREYPMGHMVSGEEIADAREWLTALP
jgi:phospholipase/carboxylesterase